MEEYFTKMLDDISKNYISLDRYKEYYSFVISAIKSKKLKNPLRYLALLKYAVVSQLYTDEEERIYKLIRASIEGQIFIVSHREAEKKNITNELIEELEEKIGRDSIISLEEFESYIDAFNVAYLANLDVNLLEFATLLLQISVEQNSVTDTRKLEGYRRDINEYVMSFVDQSIVSKY